MADCSKARAQMCSTKMSHTYRSRSISSLIENLQKIFERQVNVG